MCLMSWSQTLEGNVNANTFFSGKSNFASNFVVCRQVTIFRNFAQVWITIIYNGYWRITYFSYIVSNWTWFWKKKITTCKVSVNAIAHNLLHLLALLLKNCTLVLNTLPNLYIQKYRNVNILHEILYFWVYIFSVSIEIGITQVQCILLLLKLSSMAIQSMCHIFDVIGLCTGEGEWTLW